MHMNLLLSFLDKIHPFLSRREKRMVFSALDSVLFLVSICGAFSLRFDTFFIAGYLKQSVLVLIVLAVPFKLLIFRMVGMYRPVLRYTGLEVLYTTIKAVAISSGLLILIVYFVKIPHFPRSILLIDAVLTMLFTVGIRVFIRWLAYDLTYRSASKKQPEKVVIYGAGAAGSQLSQALSQETLYQVVAFVDDHPSLQKQVINGITVHSPEDLSRLIEVHEIKSILLAISSATRKERREIVSKLQPLGLPIKTIPGIGEIVSGKVSITEMRNIDIIDLLGRKEVLPDPALLQRNIKGKTVMVTGAGGSIGSELCRQIAAQDPEQLILYELNELALYSIEMELREMCPELELFAYLGSVVNQDRLEKIIIRNSVETIYHAAAYKHVPLIELNAVEGVFNNVLGTLSAVRAAMVGKVETFVLISTDKAVRPTNVMGATKRVAELILQAHAQQESCETRFVIVRFGNVLGSAGSVVPRFRKQIAEGSVVTVTHPEMTRYFMSIPEASRLVIQAGAMGEGGDVFLLDMGEPIKIYDLAVQMIELSGLIPGKDIEIQFSGLRPGEKLYEELLINADMSTKTEHPKIFSARETMLHWHELSPLLEKLFDKAKQDSSFGIKQIFTQIVPEYVPYVESTPERNDPPSTEVPVLGPFNVTSFSKKNSHYSTRKIL
ncbi:nucleoside-diphosphate sugar epimerase/dehydratase [Deltaproteobacteria bacterium TL4]